MGGWTLCNTEIGEVFRFGSICWFVGRMIVLDFLYCVMISLFLLI